MYKTQKKGKKKLENTVLIFLVVWEFKLEVVGFPDPNKPTLGNGHYQIHRVFPRAAYNLKLLSLVACTFIEVMDPFLFYYGVLFSCQRMISKYRFFP